ncbi:uncharacterized protein LOC126481951 [Schistocerca serialis cubense]|uniref:uncharacterized protein LOC126481951 n=1 Tax=Schistocerca serialis cubense TaxID=2023355 RepID=UPI00214E4CEA|nr:uncharacterized protein LOC126481951 [Schistocerca serialis cubense]
MGEWEAAIPPPPVRSPSDAAWLLEAGCCWLERYKTAVEGRFNKQLLLNIAELMRHAARFLPFGRIRKRLLRAAVRRLQAARCLCDGSGDATERRVLCGLALALLELRLSAECVGGVGQLRAAAEALSGLSAALHEHGRSQLLLQLHLVREVLDAPFGS